MKKINDIEVGNRLTELRKSMGLTQMEVAQKLGINRSSLTRYENGERIPKANELVELSQLYKVTVDYILLGLPLKIEKSMILHHWKIKLFHI